LALHVNVTFVPSLTTISLLVIDSTITGGTVIAENEARSVKWLRSLTYDLEIALAGSHGVRVHLAHVPAPIGLLDFSDVQVPAAVVVVRQHDPRVLSYDVVVDTEDGLSVDSHPRHLHSPKSARKEAASIGKRIYSIKLQPGELFLNLNRKSRCIVFWGGNSISSISSSSPPLPLIRLSFVQFYRNKKLQNQITLELSLFESSR
jgi:hypothetical protein